MISVIRIRHRRAGWPVMALAALALTAQAWFLPAMPAVAAGSLLAAPICGAPDGTGAPTHDGKGAMPSHSCDTCPLCQALTIPPPLPSRAAGFAVPRSFAVRVGHRRTDGDRPPRHRFATPLSRAPPPPD